MVELRSPEGMSPLPENECVLRVFSAIQNHQTVVMIEYAVSECMTSHAKDAFNTATISFLSTWVKSILVIASLLVNDALFAF